MPRQPAWSADEIEQLMQLGGDVPRPILDSQYNAWARRHGFPTRSRKAVLLKANRHRISLRAVGSWLTTGGLAGILGLPPSTVESWLCRYPDLPRRTFGRQLVRYVNRDQFKAWVLDHQHLLGGIQRARLVMLLGDGVLADRILERYPNRPTGMEATAKAVRCLDDGRVWPSIRAAAQAVYVTHSGLWHALQDRRPVAGMRFELVEQSAA